MDKSHYPTAFLLVIAVALYFMYGEFFSLKNVNFNAYKEACVKYRTAKTDAYSKDEMLSLINKVNYLLPEAAEDINDSLKKEVKSCARELSKQIK